MLYPDVLLSFPCAMLVLRKAYAKLHGTYDSIEGGFVNDGLVDMTGD